MLVILTKSVRKLGSVGEVVNVKNGFGRNYLLPQKIAIRATEENMKSVEGKRKEYEAKDAQLRSEAVSFNNNLAGTEIFFVRQAAIDGKLFGSVSSKDISKELSQKFDHDIDYSNILLSSPIKSLGVYKVEVLLHAEISAEVLVSVGRSETEAADAIRNFKNKKDDKEQLEDLEYSSSNNNPEQDTISLS